jgi:hypothetical protein
VDFKPKVYKPIGRPVGFFMELLAGVKMGIFKLTFVVEGITFGEP